jgi:hypothetical protein
MQDHEIIINNNITKVIRKAFDVVLNSLLGTTMHTAKLGLILISLGVFATSCRKDNVEVKRTDAAEKRIQL